MAKACVPGSKQFRQRPAILQQMERPAFAIDGVQVVDAHCVKNSASDMFRRDGIIVMLNRSGAVKAPWKNSSLFPLR